ncbi:MAG: hypothetical protein H6643_12505 [Caldilineaceae bacterium]|nr:hypothetical protein [Caldilineaceae bacterium]
MEFRPKREALNVIGLALHASSDSVADNDDPSLPSRLLEMSGLIDRRIS